MVSNASSAAAPDRSARVPPPLKCSRPWVYGNNTEERSTGTANVPSPKKKSPIFARSPEAAGQGERGPASRPPERSASAGYHKWKITVRGWPEASTLRSMAR